MFQILVHSAGKFSFNNSLAGKKNKNVWKNRDKNFLTAKITCN